MRVGIIGCGNISETYFECQNLFNNFNVVACADINIEAAKNSAEKYNVKAFSVDDILANDDIDVIINLTIPSAHKEIIIKSSKLIGVLEVDVKQVPKDRFTRIKINGIRQTYEIARPKTSDFSSPIAALFQPVDFLYKLFGKKPKQLKKLQKIKKEDNLRKIMAGKFDREVMMEYLEMDRNDLLKLISDCNYSEYFVKNASDLQMIEAVLDCYENYKALKKGKIERSRLPERKGN